MSIFDISRALQEAIGGLEDLESTTFPGEYDIPYLLDEAALARRIREHLESFLSAPEELVHVGNVAIKDLDQALQTLLSYCSSRGKLSPASSLAAAQELFHYLRYECDLTQQKPLIIPGRSSVVPPRTETINEVIRQLNQDARRWRALDSRKFEEILAEIWKGFGWETLLTPPTNDGGFDLRAIRNSEGVTACYLIEAKAYRFDQPVGVDVVRKLYGVVERERVTHGIIATTSRFTRGAIKEGYALRYRLSLADFRQLQIWVKKYLALSEGA